MRHDDLRATNTKDAAERVKPVPLQGVSANSGHIRATLRDGTVTEERQPYMRGGAQEPLTRADIQDKFLLNATHGGWTADRAAQALKLIGTLFDGPVDLAPLRK